MRRPPTLILVLLAADLVLAMAYLVNELFGRPRDGLTRLLDLNGEANLPAWYSAMQAFIAAMLLWTFARRNATRADRASLVLWLAPAVLLLMSCDEIAQLHERFGGHTDALLPGGSRENTVFVYTGIWMFVAGIPFVIFLAWLLVRTRPYFAISRGASALFAAGFAALLLGSLVMDGVSNAFAMHSMSYNLVILGEEVLEMTGMTGICWASFNLALASLPHHDRSAATAVTDGILAPPIVQVKATGFRRPTSSATERPQL